MTDEQKRKSSFVYNELWLLIRAIDGDITNISYSVTDAEEEEVTVTWQNGFKRRINITGDSLKGIVWDVLRRI